MRTNYILKGLFPITILMLFCLSSKGQQVKNFIHLVFKDTDNIDITKYLEHQLPQTIYLLPRTRTWEAGAGLFKPLKIKGQVHEESQMPNLLDDSLVARHIPKKQRNYLFQQAIGDSATKITAVPPNIHLIDSPKAIKKGFFFYITRPLFTSDKHYAFVACTVYYKFEGQTDLRDMLFGGTTYIFQYKQHQWTLLKKQNDLAL